MHMTSETYKRIFQNALHFCEIKATINGEEYGEDRIVSGKISGGVFTLPGIGNCASRTLNIEIFPKSTIPKRAEIKIFFRLRDDKEVSEWIQKGVFYISKRKQNRLTGALKIEAYDSMLKAEEIWWNNQYADVEFPIAQRTVVNDIASRMGISVDARTVLDEAFPVQFPVDQRGEMSMRQVLSMIAISNCGNWIITDEGNLRLVQFGNMEYHFDCLADENGNKLVFGNERVGIIVE